MDPSNFSQSIPKLSKSYQVSSRLVVLELLIPFCSMIASVQSHRTLRTPKMGLKSFVGEIDLPETGPTVLMTMNLVLPQPFVSALQFNGADLRRSDLFRNFKFDNIGVTHRWYHYLRGLDTESCIVRSAGWQQQSWMTGNTVAKWGPTCFVHPVLTCFAASIRIQTRTIGNGLFFGHFDLSSATIVGVIRPFFNKWVYNGLRADNQVGSQALSLPDLSGVVPTSTEARAKRRIAALEEELENMRQERGIKQRFDMYHFARSDVLLLKGLI
ncbi:hypothetical protein EV424DRAFT_1343619 [Suillus variegatus]|nr:hypothetical protein EV424DRAFT_1343619 [Suillus variegatus]